MAKVYTEIEGPTDVKENPQSPSQMDSTRDKGHLYTTPENQDSSEEGCFIWDLLADMLSVFIFVVCCPCVIFNNIVVVKHYERVVVLRRGRIRGGGALGPGIFITMPCIDSTTTVDIRTLTFDVPPQEILTRDSVSVTVDAVVYYRIFDPIMAVVNVSNANNATRLLAATTLRKILGNKDLTEILTDRESISKTMQSLLDDATDPWGVKVERVEIKDAKLPPQLQRAMAAEAEATREARAKVIAAEGEVKASKALKEASDVMVGSPAALQLRYLQTLSSIAAEKNSTIIFPLPLEILRPFMK